MEHKFNITNLMIQLYWNNIIKIETWMSIHKTYCVTRFYYKYECTKSMNCILTKECTITLSDRVKNGKWI